MTTTHINPKTILHAAGVIPENLPIVMLNLVRFKAQADYGNRKDILPCSGQEAYYTRYVPAFNKITADMKIEKINVVFLGAVHAHLVAPTDEVWDNVVLVEYPNFATFCRIVESSAYEVDASYHRKAALENWRLICTTKMQV